MMLLTEGLSLIALSLLRVGKATSVSLLIDELTFLPICQQGGYRRAIELSAKIEKLLERRQGNGDYLHANP